MPKRISVLTHLDIEELEKRYRQAKNGVESRQYQIRWLLAQGKRTAICGGNNWLQQNMDVRIGKRVAGGIIPPAISGKKVQLLKC